MNDCDRGRIRNRKYAKQLRDFSGLRFGKITPTDIDAFLDFQDNTFIFIETKYGDAKLSTGQRLALERVCDACADSGRNSMVIVASHDTHDDIDVAGLPVVRIRLHKKWREPSKKRTVLKTIRDYRSWINKNKRTSN